MLVQSNKEISLWIRSSIILFLPILIYWQDFVIIANEALNTELSSHIIAIPFIIGYLLYRLRFVFVSSSLESSRYPLIFNSIHLDLVFGVLFCVLAYLLRWYGTYSFNPLEYHIVSLPIFIAGLILIVFNFQTLRTLIFPVLFTLFIIPPPLELAQQAGAILSTVSARESYQILKILGIPVGYISQYGSQIITLTRANGEYIRFSIDTACSGLYSLIGLIVFATFSSYISKGSILRKIIVFVLGFPIIYALNILRIFLLIIIGYYVEVELALNVFHLLGGWVLLFFGTLIIITLADKIFKIDFFRPIVETCIHEHKDSQGLYCLQCGKVLRNDSKSITRVEALKFFALTIITLYLLSLQVPVFSLTSGRAEVFIKNPSGVETTYSVLPEIDDYELSFVYKDEEFEKVSGQNASLMYQYMPLDDSELIIWVGLEISPIKWNLHQWEICLITDPETQPGSIKNIKIDMRDIHLLDNPPISARYFAFRRLGSNLTEVILYWYSQSEFITENGFETMWTKISVIQYVQNPTLVRDAEENILPIAKAIVGFWHPISTWSGIGIAIAKYGSVLMIFTGVLISFGVAFFMYLRIDKKKKAKKLFDQIVDDVDLSILQILSSTKNKPMKDIEISSSYKAITGSEIDIVDLNLKLKKGEEIGLVTKTLTNVDDKPYVKWRTNF